MKKLVLLLLGFLLSFSMKANEEEEAYLKSRLLQILKAEVLREPACTPSPFFISINSKNNNICYSMSGVISKKKRKAKFTGEIKVFNISNPDNTLAYRIFDFEIKKDFKKESKWMSVKTKVSREFKGAETILIGIHRNYLNGESLLCVGSKLDLSGELACIIDAREKLKGNVSIVEGRVDIISINNPDEIISSRNFKSSFKYDGFWMLKCLEIFEDY